MGRVRASSERSSVLDADAELTPDEFKRDALGRDAAAIDGPAAANLAELKSDRWPASKQGSALVSG